MKDLKTRLEELSAGFAEDAKQKLKFIAPTKQEAYKEIKEEQLNTLAEAIEFIENPPTLIGKPMPQSLDLEEVILGALLVDSAAFTQIQEILKPEIFYNDKNALIFEAIQQLSAQRVAIDLVTVSEHLKRKGYTDFFYLTELINRVASSANLHFHARILVQKYMQRIIIQACVSTIQSALDDTVDVFELMQEIQRLEPVQIARHKTAVQ